jgi:hypothetical protein
MIVNGVLCTLSGLFELGIERAADVIEGVFFCRYSSFLQCYTCISLISSEHDKVWHGGILKSSLVLLTVQGSTARRAILEESCGGGLP